MDLFIVLSPACYLAFNYILFGRLAATISSQTNLSRRNENLTLIPARLMGRIFILSDVATFFIQVRCDSHHSVRIKQSTLLISPIVSLSIPLHQLFTPQFTFTRPPEAVYKPVQAPQQT